jgi:hypothetical protein
MINPELVENVKRKIENGLSPENVETILTANGWKKEDVEEVLRSLNHTAASPAGAAISPAAQNTVSTEGSAQAADSNVLISGPPALSGIRKNIGWLIGAVVIAVLVGGYFAYGYYESLPSVALPKAAAKMAALSTLHYDGQLSLSLINTAQSSTTALPVPLSVLNARYVFSFDTQTDFKNKETDTTASFETQSAGGLSSSTIQGSLELRVIQNVLYIELLSLPNLGPFNLDTLKNKWIKIDPVAVTAQMEQLGMPVPSSTANGASNFGSWGADQMKAIGDVAKKYKFFDSARYLGNEDVDGKPAFHYALSLDIKNIIAYLEDAQRIAPEKFPPDMVGNIQKMIHENPLVDIWITKATGFPAKMAASFDMDIPGLLGSAIHTNIAVHFQSFNEPVNIAVPENATDIVDIFKSFYNATSSSAFAGAPTAPSPYEGDLFKQARDSNRISDMASLKSAIALYTADVAQPQMCPGKNILYASAPVTPPAGWRAGAHMGQMGVDGTGWLPINFNSISSGSPIGTLPVDPVNDPKLHLMYIYACDPSKISNGAPDYEIDAIMESQKNGPGGPSDVASTDGGNDPQVFEMGTDLTLIPKGFYNAVFGGAPSSIPSTPIPSQISVLENSRDARRISDLRSVQVALELYFSKNGCYPMAGSSKASPCAGVPGVMTWSSLTFALQNGGIGLSSMPDDPSAGSGSHYFYASGGNTYEMGANLENQASPALNSSDHKGDLLSRCVAPNAYCVQP